MQRKGLSFVEILVSLVLLSLIMAAVAAALSGGFSLLRKAEYKSRAMGIAYLKMNEALTHTYASADLQERHDQGWDFSDTDAQFNWSLDIEEDITARSGIPYKNITVTCAYRERFPDGTLGVPKEVRLANVVPYAYIHSVNSSAVFGYPHYIPICPASAHTIPQNTDFQPLNHDGSPVATVNFKVPKDLIVFYSLAIKYQKDSSQVNPESYKTVYTRLLVDGVSYGVTTCTPILSQPFINNIVTIPNRDENKNHKLQIQWTRDAYGSNCGVVELKTYDVNVLAYENLTSK